MKQKLFFFLLFYSIAFATPLTELPSPVKNYFKSVVDNDLDLMENTFSDSAEILEVTRNIRGKNAIRYWAETEVMGGNYKIIKIISSNDTNVEVIVEFIPKGSRQGFRANYKFKINNKLIVYMNLQYAD